MVPLKDILKELQVMKLAQTDHLLVDAEQPKSTRRVEIWQ